MTAAVPPIEYRHMSGRTLSVADPCTFRDYCIPGDAQAWVYLARQWVGAAEAAAETEQQLLTLSGLRTYVEQLAEAAATCTVADCRRYVEQLRGATVRARMLVLAWGGTGPAIPGPWEPSSGWLPSLLGQGGGVWKVLPWAVLLWALTHRRSSR